MIQCKECGKNEPVGAIFCNECGAYLLGSSGTDTKLPFADTLSAPSQPSLIGQDFKKAIHANKITFVIPNSGRRAKYPLKSDINIGRTDPDSNWYPTLDLTPDDGAESGVSRRHATIKTSSQGTVVLDLGSTNGTRLNNFRLPPDLPYPLKSGDELRIGQLLLHIFLE